MRTQVLPPVISTSEPKLTICERIVKFIDQMIGAIADQIFHQSYQNGCVRNLSGKITGSNFDEERSEKTIRLMQTFGALRQTIKTPDGAMLDSLHLTQQAFKEAIENQEGKIKESVIDGRRIRVIETENEELAENLRKLINSWKSGHSWKEVSDKLDTKAKKVFQIADFDESEKFKKGVIWRMSGMGPNMSFHKRTFMRSISLGQDLFMVDWRNFHKSRFEKQPDIGLYTEVGMYLDVEEGYKFLRSKYRNDQITLVSTCIGSGPATYLAKKHQGMNLVMENSFMKAEGFLLSVLPKIMHPLGRSMVRGIRYRGELLAKREGITQNGFNVGEHLKDVRVNKALVMSTSNDQSVPEGDAYRIEETLKMNNRNVSHAVYHCDLPGNGHYEDPVVDETWDAFREMFWEQSESAHG